MDTKSHLYKTVHRSHKPAQQIADECGMSYSYLCRAALPEDESGAKFPLEKLVPVMKSAGDYSVLKHLNSLCGLLTVKAPRGFKDKRDETDAVNHYNTLCSAASKQLMDFFRSPSNAKMQQVNTTLQDVMEYSASLQRRIKTHNQTEMEL